LMEKEREQSPDGIGEAGRQETLATSLGRDDLQDSGGSEVCSARACNCPPILPCREA
jgi:hypothetical protein